MPVRRGQLWAVLFSLGLAVWPASAQENKANLPAAPAAEMEPTAPDMLGQLRKIGMQINSRSAIQGLNSWVAEKDGQKALILALPNTDNVLIGNVFDPQGNNVTNHYLADAAPAAISLPAPAKTELPAAFKSLAALNSIVVGESGQPVYLFLDPLCGPCRQIYQQITAQQVATPNQVQLHVVPIGMLSKNSAAVAAGLWAQADHAHALQQMVALAAEAKHAAELDRLHQNWIAQAKDADRQAIDKNTQFLQNRKLTAVPVLFWLDAQSKPKMIKGTPKDLQNILQGLFDTPAS